MARRLVDGGRKQDLPMKRSLPCEPLLEGGILVVVPETVDDTRLVPNRGCLFPTNALHHGEAKVAYKATRAKEKLVVAFIVSNSCLGSVLLKW